MKLFCTSRMSLTVTPSMLKATADSNAALMAVEPMPRSVIWPPAPVPPLTMVKFGTSDSSSAI